MNQTQVQTELLWVSFNQDSTWFAVGTDQGFKVFSTNEFEEKIVRDLKGGIGIVELHYASNIMALVGGGLYPKFQDNKVIIWNDEITKYVAQVNFRDKIRNIKLSTEKIFIILEKRIYIYLIKDVSIVDQIETCSNLYGICAINTEGEPILACPSQEIGKVQIHCNKKKIHEIAAHQSQISQLAMTQLGTKLATASEKGTVIRIFDVQSGQALQELRRGSEYATITCIAFDYQEQWVACTSNQGTTHIFGLKKQNSDQQNQTQNQQSRFKVLGYFIPILNSEWSFAQFRVPDTRCKVAFTKEPNTFVVVSQEGRYYKASFDPVTGGECTKLKECQIIIEIPEQQQK